MLFSAVSEVFEKISETTKRTEIVKLLSELFTGSDDDLKQLAYLVQGKLVPDYAGVEFGISDKHLTKAFSDISGMKESVITEMFHKYGDMGNVAEEVVKAKTQSSLDRSDLTVADLHAKLMKIAKASGTGSTKVKIRTFENIILEGSPIDAKYVTRIVTGKLRLGASDVSLLAALAKAFEFEPASDLEMAYNFHPDLGRLAELLRAHNFKEISDTGPLPGIPIKVMLAERLQSIPDILEKMGGEEASFEYKYDGLRSQIHKKGSQVWIYSRGNEDQTDQFPDIVEAVKKSFSCDECILDGEAVPYNPETGELYPFQTVSQRRGRKYDLDQVVKEVPLTVFLFDVLYVDGESLVKEPYRDRRRMLEQLFTESDNFKLASQIVSGDEKEISKFFDSSIEAGCEGIVAKNISDKSIYRAGARGWLWIKFKRDYQAELADTLDLVVVGAFAGHGRRKGTYGALLMASYNTDLDRFETVTKLGTGFNDEVLFNLPNMFADFRIEKKSAMVESKMEADFWFEPGIVMEISGAEITLSPIHTCAMDLVRKDSGIAVRFPRFTGRFRDDKSPQGATTTSEIMEMYQNQNKKTSEDRGNTRKGA